MHHQLADYQQLLPPLQEANYERGSEEAKEGVKAKQKLAEEYKRSKDLIKY
jgi:hypothetical protein